MKLKKHELDKMAYDHFASYPNVDILFSDHHGNFWLEHQEDDARDHGERNGLEIFEYFRPESTENEEVSTDQETDGLPDPWTDDRIESKVKEVVMKVMSEQENTIPQTDSSEQGKPADDQELQITPVNPDNTGQKLLDDLIKTAEIVPDAGPEPVPEVKPEDAPEYKTKTRNRK